MAANSDGRVVTKSWFRGVMKNYEAAIGQCIGGARRDAGQAVAEVEVRLQSRLADLEDQVAMLQETVAVLQKETPAGDWGRDDVS